MTHEELIELYETWQSADNPNASDVLKRWADACSALRLPCAAGDWSIWLAQALADSEPATILFLTQMGDCISIELIIKSPLVPTRGCNLRTRRPPHPARC